MKWRGVMGFYKDAIDAGAEKLNALSPLKRRFAAAATGAGVGLVVAVSPENLLGFIIVAVTAYSAGDIISTAANKKHDKHSDSRKDKLKNICLGLTAMLAVFVLTDYNLETDTMDMAELQGNAIEQPQQQQQLVPVTYTPV